MVDLLNECVYLKKDKYTFIDQLFLNNNKKLVYCLIVVNGDVVHCLLESYEKPSKEEKDEAIKQYLKNKRRLISFAYKNAKPLSYKIGVSNNK